MNKSSHHRRNAIIILGLALVIHLPFILSLNDLTMFLAIANLCCWVIMSIIYFIWRLPTFGYWLTHYLLFCISFILSLLLQLNVELPSFIDQSIFTSIGTIIYLIGHFILNLPQRGKDYLENPTLTKETQKNTQSLLQLTLKQIISIILTVIGLVLLLISLSSSDNSVNPWESCVLWMLFSSLIIMSIGFVSLFIGFLKSLWAIPIWLTVLIIGYGIYRYLTYTYTLSPLFFILNLVFLGMMTIIPLAKCTIKKRNSNFNSLYYFDQNNLIYGVDLMFSKINLSADFKYYLAVTIQQTKPFIIKQVETFINALEYYLKRQGIPLAGLILDEVNYNLVISFYLNTPDQEAIVVKYLNRHIKPTYQIQQELDPDWSHYQTLLPEKSILAKMTNDAIINDYLDHTSNDPNATPELSFYFQFPTELQAEQFAQLFPLEQIKTYPTKELMYHVVVLAYLPIDEEIINQKCTELINQANPYGGDYLELEISLIQDKNFQSSRADII